VVSIGESVERLLEKMIFQTVFEGVSSGEGLTLRRNAFQTVGAK